MPSRRATSTPAGWSSTLRGRAGLHDAAGAQHQHLVAQLEALVQVVRDQQDGDVELGAHLAQHGVEVRAQGGVEPARGLVEQQQPGLRR